MRLDDLQSVPLGQLPSAVADLLGDAWETPPTAQFGEEGSVAASDATSVWRTTFAAGDLDGDGLDDALVREQGGSTNLYRAVRGLDGSTLWTAEATEFVSYESLLLPAGDLTGDGRGDLLLLWLEFSFGNETNETEEEVFAWTWHLALRSGADGATLWELAFQGSESETRGTLSTKYEVTNYYVLPFLSGDHDADGLPDLVVDAVGYDRTYLNNGPYLSRGQRTVATILDADSGNTVLSRGERAEGGSTILLPVGQAVGSPVGDLVWTRVVNQGIARRTVTFDMWDGETLSRAWTTQFGDVTHTALAGFPLGCDATGDGSEDLLAYVAEVPSGAVTKVVSGADGSVAWQREIFFPACLGSIDGGPGTDLLTVPYDPVFLYNETTIAVTLPRTDGATGEELFRTEPKFAAPDGYGYVELQLAGDADGDDVEDLLLFQQRSGGHRHEHGNETGNETTDAARTSIYVESGGSESVLVDRVFDVYAQPLAAGDLTGDGLDDLLLAWNAASSYGELDLNIEALPLVGDGWTHAWRFEAAYAQLVLTGDQAGDGGRDVVATVNQYLRGLRSRVESVSGANGVTAWALGDELIVGPPPGAQDDAGSGDDAPDSFFGAVAIDPGSYLGRLEGGDTQDFYRVKVGAESIVGVTVTPSEGQDVRLSLYRATFDEYGESYPEFVGTSDAPGDAAETVSGATGRPNTFWIAVTTVLGDGNYTLDVERTSLAVDRHAGSGTIDCMAGRVPCSEANENTTITFALSGPPASAVVGLRYLPTMIAQRVVVDVLANGELVTILSTVNHVVEIPPDRVAALWPDGGTIEFRARGPLLGAGDAPFGVVIDQPFRVCAAFAEESAPGLGCFAP